MNKYNILLADDYPYIIDGLKNEISQILNVNTFFTAKNGAEVLQILSNNDIDLLVIDIEMNEIDGITTINHIKQTNNSLKIIVQTGYYDIQHIKPLFAMDVNVIIDKQNIKDDLPKALKAVFSDNNYFSAHVTNTINQILKGKRRNPHKGAVPHLTRREKELLPFIAKGFSNDEVADKLSLSPNTINSHRANIYEKLDVHNAAQLYEKARYWGFMD